MTLRPSFYRKATTVSVVGFLVVLAGGISALRGADPVQENMPAPVNDGVIPKPLSSDSFDALIANSPFTRSLGAPDSLILTGVAYVEDDVIATLLDTETMKSHVVSHATNSQGWHLVSVGGDPAKMQTWVARIQIAGGEVVSVRYQKPPPKTSLAKSAGGPGSRSTNGGPSGGSTSLNADQVKEARQAAENYREGFTSDGYPRQPPPEMVEKLSRLSVSQREEINRQMIGHRNQGLGMEDRRKIYEDLVNRASQSRR